MHVEKTTTTPTTVKLHIVADSAQLDAVRASVLGKLAKSVKLSGFRPGKAPLHLVEKNIDQNAYQQEFLDNALNDTYGAALEQENVRPVAQPKVSITKFVPFTTLEYDAELEAIGPVTLPDYAAIRIPKTNATVTDDDVDVVIGNLQTRIATKEPVTRASKDGDEIWIDFSGTDAKTAEAISGADGKDYPLVLGSNTFIPGFEPNLVGIKAGGSKTFVITFPEDYGVAALRSKEVSFDVTVTKVQEVIRPVVDDAFAAQVGPFKTATELRDNIKSQLMSDKQTELDQAYESELLEKITAGADVAVPAALVDEELKRLEQEERTNVSYRGQTWQEHLESEGVTEAEHADKNRPGAELRVKAGLVLAEIAEKEQIDVSRQELDMQVQLLKGRYQQDEKMQTELGKPANRREIASRTMSEKTIAKLVGFASAA